MPKACLDIHAVSYYGESALVERHYVSARSRRQPSVLVFLAQDAFVTSNYDAFAKLLKEQGLIK